jgi:hypothetical protein
MSLQRICQIIYTTAEIVIGDCGGTTTFTREFDPSTGFKELKVSSK